jgi:hypothetical protein
MSRIPRCAAITAACLAALVLAVPSSAGAEEPFEFGPQPTWSVFAGPMGGGSFGSPGAGGFAGGEVSVTRLQRRFWFGLYGDAAYDFGHSAATTTAGPSVGFGFFGIDGGLAARFDDGADLGATARFLVTTGFVAFFGRWQYFPGPDQHIGQAGLLIKLPLWVSKP